MINLPLVPAGVHYQASRLKGKPTTWYVYAWRGGPQVAKIQSEAKPQLAPEILREINECIQLRDNISRDDVDPAAETTPLEWLVRTWQSDPDWKKRLGEGTKKNYEHELKGIIERWGLTPLILFYDERMTSEVYAWRDNRRSTPRAADKGISVLRQLLKFGSKLVGSCVDITRGIPTLYDPNCRANIIWTDGEIDCFVEVALANGKPELAYVIRLAALTGMRRSDLITVCRAHVREHEIIKTARKIVEGHASQILVPTFSRLAALLLELRKVPRAKNVNTLLVNASGSRWDDDHLTHEFGKIRTLANINHLDRDTPNRRPKLIAKTLHDVRGTFATKLMTEALLSDAEVASVMGWEVNEVHSIRRAYVDDKARMQGLAARMRRSPR